MTQPPNPTVPQRETPRPLDERPIQSLAVAPEVKTQLDRPKIIYHPVLSAVDGRGNSVMRPDVKVAPGLKSENLPSLRLTEYHHHEHSAAPSPLPQPTPAPQAPVESDYDYAFIDDELPPPENPEGPNEQPVVEPMMQPDWAGPGNGESGYCESGDCESGYCDAGCAEPCSPYSNSRPGPLSAIWHEFLANLHGPRSYPPGIGPEHVMNAPFFIDTTQPLNNCRIRLDAGKNWEFPDRAEYFWARTPNGLGPAAPAPFQNFGEPSVNYQDIRFYIERGSKRFSVGTELPIRAVDPELRLNTTGFADMNLTTKALLLDGKCWQLSQIFRTYFPTGSVRRGTGNGHFSLEPGIAGRYKFSDITYIHGDISYWFPIAADLEQSGQILNAGLAVSHVLIDRDRYAVIPTLELDSSTVLDGRQTPPVFNPIPVEIDTLSIVSLHPGVRIVCDKGCDCGTREFGISSGIAVTEDHWYETMIRLDFRWTY